MKRDAIWSIIILFAALRPTLCFSSSIFRHHFQCFFLEQLYAIFNKKVRAVVVPKRMSVKTCDCLHQLTSEFLAQSLLTTVHPFRYVHIDFWILRIAIRPNWDNCYNITVVPTALHLSQMKPISGSKEVFPFFL